MKNLILSFNVISPMFFLMIIGYLLVNKTTLADRELCRKANRLDFQFFLPCMLFYNIYRSDVRTEVPAKLCLFLAGSLLVLVAVLCLVVPRLVRQEDRQGVIIQAIFRSNYVIFGISIVENMYGVEATAVSSVLSTILVPMYNFFAVIVLAVYGGNREKDWGKIIINIIKNPLIIASTLGIVVSLLGISLPVPVEKTLSNLAVIATPIAFLILGGDMDFSKVRGNLKTAGWVIFVKMVLIPGVMIPVLIFMGFRDAELLSGALAWLTPISVSSYVMAQQEKADSQLAGQLVVFSSAVSVVTLFLAVFALRQLGFMV